MKKIFAIFLCLCVLGNWSNVFAKNLSLPDGTASTPTSLGESIFGKNTVSPNGKYAYVNGTFITLKGDTTVLTTPMVDNTVNIDADPLNIGQAIPYGTWFSFANQMVEILKSDDNLYYEVMNLESKAYIAKLGATVAIECYNSFPSRYMKISFNGLSDQGIGLLIEQETDKKYLSWTHFLKFGESYTFTSLNRQEQMKSRDSKIPAQDIYIAVNRSESAVERDQNKVILHIRLID